MDEKRKELQGFTIDHIKDLCGDKHIKVYGRTKDALIDQLLAAGGPEKLKLVRQMKRSCLHPLT